jgi:hypothetical protein
VLCLSRFVPDATKSPEFLACLWQGDVPTSLVLRGWLYPEGDPGTVLLMWEGDDAAGAYVERTFGPFGRLTTETIRDATPAMAAAFARDLDAFGRLLAAGGAGPDEVARQLDLRRRGVHSTSQEEAASAGRRWAAEQAG